MNIASRVRSCWRANLWRSRMDTEMDSELRFHLEAYAEDLIRSGVPRTEALRRARLEFGIGALLLSRVIASQLYGVSPTDPVTFVAVSVLLTVVALAACYICPRGAQCAWIPCSR